MLELAGSSKKHGSSIKKYSGIHEIASGIGVRIWRYCPIGKCDTFQKDMAKQLDTHDIKYKKINISATSSIYSDAKQVHVSNIWKHHAIEVDWKIYDNLYPKWIDKKAWEKDLGINQWYSDGPKYY